MLVIVLLLSVTIGIPFLVVSASGPLLQHWLSLARPSFSPYRLYALSNFGSFLGLISYPFFVEPRLGLRNQTILWSVGYALYALICVWCAMPLFQHRNRIQSSANFSEPIDSAPRRPEQILILALAACGSLVLLASTNQICRDIAVIPFLWVLPLSLYLTSFIVCFGYPRVYNRYLWTPVLLISLSAVVYLLHQDYADQETDLYLQIVIYSASLFACCMACHGELFRLKPSAQHLTSYYLMIALGGALGGMFVNLIAPVLFKGYWEYHGGLVATVALLGICVFWKIETPRSPLILLSGKLIWVGTIIALMGVLILHIQDQEKDSVLTKRNFYGILRVTETDKGTEFASRALYHGRITHGEQFLIPQLRPYPRAYYGPTSGVSLAINRHPQQFIGWNNPNAAPQERGMHIGAIGLGVGTIATYARPEDIYRFYEINPDVDRVAREYFNYLKDSKGKTSVIIGDGRISLERELRDQDRPKFDIIVVDAFSGDAIPMHLLTREAFALYWIHLKPTGILALHITNNHLDFSPVVRALSREIGKEAVWIKDFGNQERGTYYSDWYLVTNNQIFLNDPFVLGRIEPWPTLTPREILWTDDYSNLFQIVTP